MKSLYIIVSRPSQYGELKDCTAIGTIDGHNYSYVNVAVDQDNFFTIAFDRPGIGSSSIEGPLKALQMPVELSVIYEMTKMLRKCAL